MPSGLPASVKTSFKDDLFAQAVAQAVAAANNGTAPNVTEVAVRPSDAPNAVATGDNGTRQVVWYNDMMASAAKQGYDPMQVFVHELLHMWYRNFPAGGGDYPNPFPGEASFIPSPSVTFSDGTVVQFNLLNPDGTLNMTQYIAYEHVLIHDDLVGEYGTDTTTGTLTEALTNATSVTLPGGTPQKMDALTAQNTSNKLRSSSLKDRKAKRPPSAPASNGGCTSTSARSRLPATVRSVRDHLENVGGFVVPWDGVPPPSWPN